MKFKQVNVYTGYAENGVQNVVEFTATSLMDAVSVVEQNQLDKMLEQDERLDEDWYNEFFGNGSIHKGTGIVSAGEENVLLVFAEDSEWYDKVDSFEDWSEELFEKWNKFLVDWILA